MTITLVLPNKAEHLLPRPKCSLYLMDDSRQTVRRIYTCRSGEAVDILIKSSSTLLRQRGWIVDKYTAGWAHLLTTRITHALLEQAEFREQLSATYNNKEDKKKSEKHNNILKRIFFPILVDNCCVASNMIDGCFFPTHQSADFFSVPIPIYLIQSWEWD